MARDKNRNGIPAHGTAHRLGGFTTQLRCQFSVSYCFSIGNLQKQFPDFALKRCAFWHKIRQKIRNFSLKISGKPLFGIFQYAAGAGSSISGNMGFLVFLPLESDSG